MFNTSRRRSVRLQDFEIQSLERRINRMQGEKSTEEQAMLEKKISELEAELQRKRDDLVMLTDQRKRIEEETRRLTKRITDVDRDKKNETKKIEELELHADNAQRLIKKLTEDKEVRLDERCSSSRHIYSIRRTCSSTNI